MLDGRERDSAPEVEWFRSADCITAGFPCQDISFAGGGAGLSGERSGLWWQVRRTIRMVRPRIALLENVAALLRRGMGTVLGSLAAIGYDAEWHCIPAAAVGAEHERDRIWIIATDSDRDGELQSQRCEPDQWRRLGDGPEKNAANPDRAGRARRVQAGAHDRHVEEFGSWLRSAIDHASPLSRDYWNHKPVLGRGFHGVPDRLDRIDGLGNAVVPQVVEAIGEAVLRFFGRGPEKRPRHSGAPEREREDA